MMNRILRILLMLLVCSVTFPACTRSHLTARQEVNADLEAMHEAAVGEVADTQRRTLLNRAINGLDAELVAFAALHADFRSDIEKLNAQPDARREQFVELLDRFEQQRIAARTRVTQFHFDMIAATTPREWSKLARYERAALEAVGR